MSSDSIDAWVGPKAKPTQKEWSNGDTCPAGQYKGQKGELSWAVDGKARTGNPSDYKMKDGETLAIYFLPKGAEQALPAGRLLGVRQHLRQRDRGAEQELAVPRDRRHHDDRAERDHHGAPRPTSTVDACS